MVTPSAKACPSHSVQNMHVVWGILVSVLHSIINGTGGEILMLLLPYRLGGFPSAC